MGGSEQRQLASASCVLSSEPPSMEALLLSTQAWLEIFVCAVLSVRLLWKVRLTQGTPSCDGLSPACLQAAAASGLTGNSLGRPADDDGCQPASAPAQAAASQSLSEHKPAQPDCERSPASTASGSSSRQPENDTGPAQVAAAPAPAGPARLQEAQLLVCMLTTRQNPAGQDGTYSPVEDPLAGSNSPLAGSAPLPGSWWGADFCEELDSDGEGAAVEQQGGPPQTVLVQGNQVGARQAASVEPACLQMWVGGVPCCSWQAPYAASCIVPAAATKAAAQICRPPLGGNNFRSKVLQIRLKVLTACMLTCRISHTGGRATALHCRPLLHAVAL